MRKMFSEKQIDAMIDGKVVEKELVSYDGENLKDADGNTIEVGGTIYEELWTNASPTSSFNAQEIEIENLENYNIFIVVNKLRNNNNTLTTNVFVYVSDDNYQYLQAVNVSNYKLAVRLTTIKKETNKFIFASGYDEESGQSNSYAIPFKIYGIK